MTTCTTSAAYNTLLVLRIVCQLCSVSQNQRLEEQRWSLQYFSLEHHPRLALPQQQLLELCPIAPRASHYHGQLQLLISRTTKNYETRWLSVDQKEIKEPSGQHCGDIRLVLMGGFHRDKLPWGGKMAAACYITLLYLQRPYDHLSCCGFNERLLINTVYYYYYYYTILTYRAGISLKKHFSPSSSGESVKVREGCLLHNISGAFTA